jgi:hypothetical protein
MRWNTIGQALDGEEQLCFKGGWVQRGRLVSSWEEFESLFFVEFRQMHFSKASPKLSCEENSNTYGECRLVVEEMSMKITLAYY